MLITYQFRNMPQGRSNSFEGWIADGGVPVADADQTAALSDSSDLIIAQVASAIASASYAGMGHDDGTGGEGEDVVDELRRGMSQVHDQALLFHHSHERAPNVGQPAFDHT